MRRLAPLAGLCLLAACAHARGAVPASPAPARSDSDVTVQTAVARRAIVAALLAGDTAALLDRFDSNAVVTYGSRSVQGRNAILAALLQGGAGRADLNFGPNRFETCQDGAIEWGGDYTMLTAGRSGVDTLRGRYSLRWSTSSGQARIVTLAMMPAGHGTDPAPARCALQRVSQVRHSRFVISAMPNAAVGYAGAIATISNVMRSRGYAEGNMFGPDPAHSVFKHTDNGSAPMYLAARFRPAGRIWIEGVTSLGAFTGVARYMVNNGNWAVSYRADDLALLGEYAWHDFRFGVGPGLIRSSWVRDYNTVDSSFAKTQTGIASQAAWDFPMNRHVLLGARVFGIAVPQVIVPATGPAAAVPATNSFVWATIGLSLAL